MHSSRMRNPARLPYAGICFPGGGGTCLVQGGCTCLVPGGVPGPGESVPGPGGVYLVRYSPPPWTEWQTGVKILPCPKLRLRAVINDKHLRKISFLLSPGVNEP